LKRKRRDVYGYGSGEEVSDESDDEVKNVGSKRKPQQVDIAARDVAKLAGQSTVAAIKQIEQAKTAKVSGVAKKREQKARAKVQGGHRVVQSGEAYKSEKGHGDVLKAGKHEPYAYFQLNPEMLNPRKKKQAIKTFEGVVSHGKKTDKRSGKKIGSGALAGLAISKK